MAQLGNYDLFGAFLLLPFFIYLILIVFFLIVGLRLIIRKDINELRKRYGLFLLLLASFTFIAIFLDESLIHYLLAYVLPYPLILIVAGLLFIFLPNINDKVRFGFGVVLLLFTVPLFVFTFMRFSTASFFELLLLDKYSINLLIVVAAMSVIAVLSYFKLLRLKRVDERDSTVRTVELNYHKKPSPLNKVTKLSSQSIPAFLVFWIIVLSAIGANVLSQTIKLLLGLIFIASYTTSQRLLLNFQAIVVIGIIVLLIVSIIKRMKIGYYLNGIIAIIGGAYVFIGCLLDLSLIRAISCIVYLSILIFLVINLVKHKSYFGIKKLLI